MGGEEWIYLSLVPSILWVPTGPFVMAALGVWCARRPGCRPRLCSVLVPLEPVTAPCIAIVLPDWNSATADDLLGYFYIFVLGITLAPWLLGYGTTRVTRAVRARRRHA
jgi:hypothetical protein